MPLSRIAVIVLLVTLAIASGLARRADDDTAAAAIRPPAKEHCREEVLKNARIQRRLICGGGVRLNSDDARTLRFLPGIGPVRAAAIVEHRKGIGSFSCSEELLEVDGIGPKTLQKLEPWLDPISSETKIGDK